MSNTALNRTTVALLTNKSGGSVAQGDVVIVDSANASAFTTTTTSAYVSGSVGVVLEPNGIASNAIGTVAFGGYVPIVNLSGSASLGDVFKTHTVAKQAVRHVGPIVIGDFGQVLGTGTTPAALLWGEPSGGGGGGGGGSLELTDGTHDLTSVTKITTTMLTVGGTAGASTLIPSLTSAQAELGSDVHCTPNHTFVDGPSVTLAAGTWLLMAQVLVEDTNGAAFFAAKLWDGTTVAASGEATTGAANFTAMMPLYAIVTPTGSTTYKISAAADDGTTSGWIKATGFDSTMTTGNHGTRIVAVRIA